MKNCMLALQQTQKSNRLIESRTSLCTPTRTQCAREELAHRRLTANGGKLFGVPTKPPDMRCAALSLRCPSKRQYEAIVSILKSYDVIAEPPRPGAHGRRRRQRLKAAYIK
ncbi:unnamed protein product [Ceratitis capitata]|uniref:(Mediterranean fruit fly) hypothetical protein n=1 Tax=Ceratitis capitata TaxID=7213 RepID=A0A811U0Q1_CERCA|nr:unnamed protein product [Ceratitis capitata]